MSDAKPEEVEKQEPEKPKKSSGGLSLPLIIGAAVGVLVIIVLGVVLGMVVASKFFPSQPAEAGHEGDKKEHSVKDKHAKEFESTDESYLSGGHDVIFMETGRITTNPKGASSIFVVMNFGLEFKKMDPENEELKGFADAHGKLNLEDPVFIKLNAKIKGKINQFAASYTDVELQEKRTELPELLKKELRSVFKDYELVLGSVTVLEFIIQ